jgi:hypothetical protein
MLTTIEGIYENGSIILNERPVDRDSAKVLVTFLREDKDESRPSRLMTFGMIGSSGAYNDEDFAAAKANVRLDDF